MLRFRTTKAVGDQGEKLAEAYLIKQGLKPIEQNIRSRYGEIDLLMRDKQEWVFVEVRYRRNNDFGGGIESITISKQRKLIRTAEHYMQSHDKTAFNSCRFDIIELSGDLNAPNITWIEDAFQVNA